ncbi:acetyl-CoA hydrolase [Amycolatopsis sp. RM579]|uniref:Acetyl-CoA hydrolase n=1 Tax=Amycolatopsis pithecellobii TaxID=664692 RepID=A0A6N7Z2Q0_9PSEU|nr:acetyl-CoA hydrolase [Amycolatopsis pithecellobii]
MNSVEELDFRRYLRVGDGVLWAQACAEPLTLVNRLISRPWAEDLSAFLGIPVAGLIHPEHAALLRFTSYTGAGANSALHEANAADLLPAHYSSLPDLLRADVVLLQLSPPDSGGRYSLGLARDYVADVLPKARVIIGEVNPAVPWTYGGPALTADDLTVVVPSRHAPAEYPVTEPTAVHKAIAANVAELIEDGATLQVGIGSLAQAVLAGLTGRRQLGVHSGLLPEALVDLMEQGVVTGERKSVDRGVAVGGILLGGDRLFRYAHRNERILLRETSYTHDPDVLAAQEKLVALNSAIEVDLTGAVNAEVARGRYVGSVGGAVDFLRGAARSRGGVPVIMLPSRAGPVSRVVAKLTGPVSTPRSDAGVVVTEHGIADLRGLSLRQRAERMIAIAAPEARAELDEVTEAALAAAKGV